MQNAFDVLELSHVLESLSSLAKTEQAKEAFLSLRPLDEHIREYESNSLSQMMKMIESSSLFPLSESADLSKKVDAAKKGATLSEEDFSRVLNDLNTVHEVKKHVGKIALECVLKEQIEGLSDLEPLRQAILRVLAPDMSIKDTASVDLKRIRGTLERKKRELTSRLGAILDEHKPYMSGNSWTMRNGHYVLPIANSFKNKVRGIVQDVSASGGTMFVEPEYLVRIHNDIAILEAEEKEEIRKILHALSSLLGQNAKEYLAINQMLGYLDFLQAKTIYATQIDGHLANKSEDGTLFIPRARHPLIDKNKVVPNDFSLLCSRKILILSGPNAGGKTVALKTLGVLVMMFMMALPLPCALGAEVPSVPHVYLDIGDSQSIFDNLSTFSGHITNVKDILAKAGEGDLVLLDELGTGTSPKEGEALALAILDELREKGCYALLSSHFEGLKAKALSSKDVENASLLFDEENLSPTYQLRIGLPGESYGIEVARRLGLGDSVLEKAKFYLDKEEELSIESSLKHLAELTKAAEEKDARISALEAEIKEKEALIARKSKEIDRKERTFEAEMKKQKEAILEEAKAQVDEAIKILSNPNVKLHEAIEAKKKLENLEEEKRNAEFNETIVLGDYVELPDYGVEGKVVRLQGNKIEIQTTNGFSFKADLRNARHIQEPVVDKKKQKKTPIYNVDALPSGGLSLEVKLIGMRVDEAMAELDHYLDRCRLKGFKRVRVIHGLGSGALRRATHEYLKAHSSFVEKFELGGEFEGGGGATVVYLK